MEKLCKKCNSIKSENEFGKNKTTKDGYQYNCKSCCELIHKKYRENNKDKIKKRQEIWVSNNVEKYKTAVSVARNRWAKNNPDKLKEYRSKSDQKNKSKRLLYLKEWKKNNPEKVKKYRETMILKDSEKYKKSRAETSKKYYEKNKTKINGWLNGYMKEKRTNDVLFKLSANYRCRINTFYKRIKKTKNFNTETLLGCSWENFKNHIELQFVDGMCFSNYGEWHIDHIIPLSSAKNEEEIIKLCHYSNLQPLWASDNLKKGDKIML